MFEQKHSVVIIALAVTVLALAGAYTTMSNPSVTGSVGTVDSLHPADLRLEDLRLVLLEPRVGAGHDLILNNPEIEIQQQYGTAYIALVPVDLIPSLKTFCRVEFLNS